MAGGVDQIKLIVGSVLSLVIYADGTSLYGYSALALKLHVVEELIFHVALCDGIGEFENTVGKSAFSVIYVRNYREIANFLLSFRRRRHFFLRK